MSLQPGMQLGNYEVLGELGSGGMGEVYKAKDLKLGREVAIKVLPQEMAADAQRLRRFEQEARAASALNHPNIVTIYEIGEYEGTPYIAMEYVEGKSVRELLSSGRLPNDKLIRYATQMAEGLAKAHQAGIVHRDLKPENIVISNDGYVKILDFGLAKLLPEGDLGAELSTLARDTAPGAILGTVGYMSPEQARGESADFRSDQFSLGTILYEMVTGTRAFERNSSAQTLAAIIEHVPEPVTLLNPSVAGHLAAVIDRCLAKNPSERYETTWELAKEIHSETLAVPQASSGHHPLATVAVAGLLAIILVMILGLLVPDVREWVTGREIPEYSSIAVLPFSNVQPTPETEYVSEGLASSIRHNLAQLPSLSVASTSSVLRYKDRDVSELDVGEALGVQALLVGSVNRFEDRLSIQVELVRVEDGTLLWADQYQREYSEIMEVQSEISEAVTSGLRVTLTGAEEASLTKRYTNNMRAYDAYLKGRYHLNQSTPESVQLSVEYFKQAIAEDPGYALAYAGLAETFPTAGFYMPETIAEAGPEARAAAEKALEIDDSLAEAHTALGAVRLFADWDWDGARRAFERAIELNPSYPLAYQYYAWSLEVVGRHDEAIAAVLRAEELDPLSTLISLNVGWRYYMARRYDDAVRRMNFPE